MTQFDTFIFSSSLFYFIISFFAVLYLNYTKFLPQISSLLKLRFKLLKNATTSYNESCVLGFSSSSLFLISDYSELFIIIAFVFFLYLFNKIIINSLKEFIIIGIITFCFILLPSFQFYFTVLSGGILLILTFPYFDKYIPGRLQLAKNLLFIFNQLGLLSYLEKVYLRFFDQPSNVFYLRSFLLYSFYISYVFASKFLFLNRLNISELDNSTLLFVYVLLFFGLFACYYRLLLNSSIICYNLSTSFLKTEGLENSSTPLPSAVSSDTNNSAPSQNRRPLFDFSKTIIYNNEHSRNASRFKWFGLFVGIGTCGAACYAGYQQRLQTIAAQEQVKIAREQVRAQQDNNYEMQRQNDLEMINQGMMSKEEYFRRHPIDITTKK